MGVFINTAAYGNYPIGAAPFCTATSQQAGYTYYTATCPLDASIPPWTIRIINTYTGSSYTGFVNGIGCIGFSANAQYSTASFAGAQANSNVSNRSTNGAVRSYGLVMKLTSFSSESCYVDSWETLSTGPEPSRLYATLYGNTSYLNVVRDTTKYVSAWSVPVWGNQPYLNKCATYALSSATSHAYISCSSSTPTTSSVAETVCAKEWQWIAGGTTSLVISNYYTGSCGTY